MRVLSERAKLRFQFFLCVFFSLIMEFPCFAEIEPDPLKRFDETDLDCILYSTRKMTGAPYPAGTFFVFLGLDENNSIRCVPLSGAGQRWVVDPSLLLKTGYRKDTPCYEIALDAYKIFADYYQLNAKEDELNRKVKLLGILGKYELVQPLHDMIKNERLCTKILDDGYWNFRSAVRKAKKNKDTMDEDDILDEVEKMSQSMNDNGISPSIQLIENAVNDNNLILATALYLHLVKYWDSTRSQRNKFQCGRTKAFSKAEKEIKEKLKVPLDEILSVLKDRCKNLAFKQNAEEFRRIYPETRGLWEESPPTSEIQLKEFFNRFFAIRREMNGYSAVSEFEKWGNCRLSVLSCTQSFAEADYLNREFRDALKKHKILFPDKKK